MNPYYYAGTDSGNAEPGAEGPYLSAEDRYEDDDNLEACSKCGLIHERGDLYRAGGDGPWVCEDCILWRRKYAPVARENGYGG